MASTKKKIQSILSSLSPQELANINGIMGTAAWKNLPTDMKYAALSSYQVQVTNDKDKAAKLATALEQAKAQSDPYMKQFYNIAIDNTLRSFEQLTGDYESSKARTEKSVKEINEDLATGKGDLDLSLQAELATQARAYANAVGTTKDNAAMGGLTFSSKRAQALANVDAANTDIVESTRRNYNQQVRNLETQAMRGNETAALDLADLKRKYGESVTSLGRTLEQQVGSDGIKGTLPSLPGVTPLGGVSGTLYEQGVQDVEQRKSAIYNDLTGASLNFV